MRQAQVPELLESTRRNVCLRLTSQVKFSREPPRKL
ncbi:hypothetical protein ACVWZX_001210 [Deinococcus sp. UYEF24]